MRSGLWKNILREMKDGLGRYLAIFFIVFLGVGFFAGLCICEETMVETANKYISYTKMYDYKIVSPLGFNKKDNKEFSQIDGIVEAEGANYIDAVTQIEEGKEEVMRFHSITKKVNQIQIIYGMYPQHANECIADAMHFSKEDIGKKLYIAKTNEKNIRGIFAYEEYIISGIGKFPYYLNNERGNSNIGTGHISAYICVLKKGFTIDSYMEIYLKANTEGRIYSKEYKKSVKDLKKIITKLAEKKAAYVLTREENIGYVSFENDASIISGIAKVFPVFFFLVAALICATTMSRMVKEQRTQIGILKSLGYNNGSITGKYLFYSGSAGIVGCLSGYFFGTYAFPFVIWKAYGMTYEFSDNIVYVFNIVLLSIALAGTILATMGVTLLCCGRELSSVPASLIRPKAPEAGKKIFLEKIKFLWKRLSFLKKVSLRNIMRYKSRFYMMILGIGGCTALLVTGLGIRDSIKNIGTYQYGKIIHYDVQISFKDTLTKKLAEHFKEEHKSDLEDILFFKEMTVNIQNNSIIKNITVTAPLENSLDKYVTTKSDGKILKFPEKNEIILSCRLAEILEVSIGDTIILTKEDKSNNDNEATLTVSGIFDNYIGNFAYISLNTYQNLQMIIDKTDKKVSLNNGINGAYIRIGKEIENDQITTNLLKDEKVSSIIITNDSKDRLDNMMASLDYIVLVVIICALALAFVVLYNLTNINIVERIREIATIKVLGFYDRETTVYVFRENHILTIMGILFGLLLGKFLHNYVMMQIQLDSMKFDIRVNASSYIISAIITFSFALFMQWLMKGKIKKINMVESLKSVE